MENNNNRVKTLSVGDADDCVNIMEEGEGAPAAAVVEQVDPGDTCYICWTSGTTGKPKGQEWSHRGLWNFCHLSGWLEMPDVKPAVSQDMVLQLTVLYHG